MSDRYESNAAARRAASLHFQRQLMDGPILAELILSAGLEAERRFGMTSLGHPAVYGLPHLIEAGPLSADCGTLLLGCDWTFGGCPPESSPSACLCPNTDCGDCASQASVNMCQDDRGNDHDHDDDDEGGGDDDGGGDDGGDGGGDDGGDSG